MHMTTEKAKVLVVDDVEANLVALQALLGQLDCEVVTAQSGNEALRLLLGSEFAVMLLDVQMPDMDGYEVAQFVRENPLTRDVPIVFVTAMHEAEEAAIRGYGAGAVDFLFKPINAKILRGKVSIFLELYQNRKSLSHALTAQNEAVAELEAFSYSVSHDLKAPLRPLQGFSELLLADYAQLLDERGQDYLRRISSAAKRMEHLIDDLLLLSKMGRAPITARQLDVAEISREVMAELARNQPERRVQFESVAPLPAMGDARLVRIALENLLRNAWKFTGQKSEGRIELGVVNDSGSAVMFIKDNGAGFDPTYASKLFQPFQRLHSAADFEGTGIGLAIVDRIIRRHGGKIWAESRPGEGATFFFQLGAQP
jgi:two-component system sensor histidine kinase/response regulator